MKKILFYLGMTSLLILTSCKPELNVGIYSVQGILKDKNGIIKDAKVTIDSALNWTTTSSNEGYFIIKDISSGVHNLQITKVNADSSFTDLSYKVSVSSDVNLASLLLPSPLKLLNPTTIEYNSVSIAWNQTDGEDFYEYKLYRHDSPGLDETSGELVYVSTSKNDTAFKDSSLLSNHQYYYRVFLMNKYGKMGGSNIIKVKTLTRTFSDGDFENIDFQNYWIKHGMTEYVCHLDSLIKYQGKYSLFANGYYGNENAGLKSKQFNLDKNTTYEISYMAKYNGSKLGMEYFGTYIYQANKIIKYFYVYPPIDSNGNVDNSARDIDWTLYKFTFSTKDDNSTIYVDFSFTVENIWIDDIKITKQ